MKLDLDPIGGIAVFTDGSSNWKDRSGGWAWVALDIYEGVETDSGRASDTTNNQMELFAPTDALRRLYAAFGAIEVLVQSDSEYVVKGMNAKTTRKRVKNLDWWADLEDATSLHEYVCFEHVKGHHLSKYNNMADELAGAARKSL